MILFASGDVGGARALLPVLRLLDEQGISFALTAHGHINGEAPTSWPRLSVEESTRRLDERQTAGLVFATSVSDTVALTLARRASSAGLPTVHVLDNWSNYRLRLEHDGQPFFVPTAYAVMDDLARDAAVRDGVPVQILFITGHPNLADLAGPWPDSSARELRLAALGLDPDRTTLAFASEPATQDGGLDPTCPTWRGYTEASVLQLFCQALAEMAPRLQVLVMPHPREDIEVVSHSWNEAKGGLAGGVIRLPLGREALGLVDAIAGMTSLLLYEAWLLGLPSAALEPGLPKGIERSLAFRSGLIHARHAEDAILATKNLARAAMARQRSPLNQELVRHIQAPTSLLRLIKRIIKPVSTMPQKKPNST